MHNQVNFRTSIIVVLLAFFASVHFANAQVAKRMEAQASAADVAQLKIKGDQLADNIADKIESRLAGQTDELFIRHLKSTAALVKDDWNRASLVVDQNTKAAENFLKYTQIIIDGLDADAGTPQPYSAGQRSYNFAFVSKYDNTLQMYQLRLPENYDPQKKYPVIVYLHGHTPNPIIWYTSLGFNPMKPKPAGNNSQPEIEPHFSLAPWGRENTGYRHAGETDVWEAIKDFQSRFNYDEDRMYLTGHSMGGFGTWLIGTRTPDVWAAMGIYAGGTRRAEKGMQLGVNIAHMPVVLWHGEKDRTVPVSEAYEIRDELRLYGNEATLMIDPEGGHMVTRSYKTPLKQWLLQHKRQRPDQFSFMSDTYRHRGAWGITMRRQSAVDMKPRFDCRIDGQNVYILSKGTAGLQVKLGEDGLGMEGDVKVFWNNKEVYSGEPKTIEIGDWIRSRWD